MTPAAGAGVAWPTRRVSSNGAMPGCLSYVIARDPTDADAIWITEVRENRERREASLKLPSVQEAIARGRPLIVGFGERFETAPVGGHGLRRTS